MSLKALQSFSNSSSSRFFGFTDADEWNKQKMSQLVSKFLNRSQLIYNGAQVQRRVRQTREWVFNLPSTQTVISNSKPLFAQAKLASPKSTKNQPTTSTSTNQKNGEQFHARRLALHKMAQSNPSTAIVCIVRRNNSTRLQSERKKERLYQWKNAVHSRTHTSSLLNHHSADHRLATTNTTITTISSILARTLTASIIGNYRIVDTMYCRTTARSSTVGKSSTQI